MERFCIGSIIRELRVKRKQTLENLGEGICDAAVLSRIEHGIYQPSKESALLLLQRLGVVTSDYFGLRNFDELELEELKLGIKNANARFDYIEAIQLLDTLEQKLKKRQRTNIMEQIILSERATNGYIQDGCLKKYDLEKRLEMLLAAIKLTVPRLDLGDIGKSLLGLDETTIVIKIANTLSAMERYCEAIGIYAQLMSCIQKRLMDISEASLIIPLLTYNYSRALGKQNRSEEEIEIAQLGIDSCVRYGKSHLYGELLINKACALHRLGRVEEAKHWAIRSYYFIEGFNIGNQLKTIAEYMLDTYNWTPED